MSWIKLIFLFALLGVFSCSYEVSDNRYSKWVVAVYMAGDNNLSDYATLDLKEMMDAGSDENVRVVVLCDRGEGTTVYEVKNGWLEPVEGFGNLNTGSPDTLKLFLDSIFHHYSFSNLALVVWDHGNGWEIASIDDTSKDYLTMYEIYKVLKDNSIHLGFLGFDECLAGMVEVFYTFKDFADVMVASEASEPGNGWDYKGLIEVFRKTDLSPFSLGKAAVDSYYTFYRDYCAETGVEDCVLAAVNSTDMDGVVNSLENIVSFYSPSTSLDFKIARENSLYVDPYFSDYIDLYSFADSLFTVSSDEILVQEINNLKSALDKFYVRSVFNKLKGVSIYFPQSASDISPEEYYNYSYFSPYNLFTQTNWDEFLESFVN
ncbi:clostripain-related cysteine peptidase [Desulfurobacterium atlanticum]|uniref:Cysteine peptidase C11 family protein n=1 Tax=Desulfurobacterium atlanticum TaxID=240169 RepID=A0A238ZQ46_9BACT|nr:clostripain-related cysteine peptidase [Desulfurobacterium atlanticum]SNR84783.1 hypothetical protein SAMN06265340_11043 [Desulfurobacterium atlanticum]